MSLSDEFERLAHNVQNALEYANNSHSVLDVYDAVREGKAQFFSIGDSCVITEIVDYPQKSVCRIWLAGGNMDELLEAEKHITALAKSHGCDGMEIIGRRGWQRVLKDYKPSAVVLVKDLKDE